VSIRDYVKLQIDTLPEKAVEKVQEFIEYQKFMLGIYENDTDYLNDIPSMVESIQSAASEKMEDSTAVSDIWTDV